MKTLNQTHCGSNRMLLFYNLLIRKQKWRTNPNLNSMRALTSSTSPAQPCLK